jgi:Glycosyltransferase family 87
VSLAPSSRRIEPQPLTLSRVAWLASLAFFGVLPALTLVILFASAVREDSVAIDFWQFHAAARAILDGASPYLPDVDARTQWGGPYPYPPLPALLAIPSTVASERVAGFVVMVILVGVALAVPWVVGVRDWRCYGLLLLWPPVISAIQTGNVTLWFALAAAVAWRYRDRMRVVATAIGITLAAKFFLWPLVVWLAATRRTMAAVGSLAVGAVVLVASWAVIGFAGFVDYPSLLRTLEEAVGEDSYTLYVVGTDLGVPSPAARLAWLAVGFALVGAIVLLARRRDERTAFIVAVAASLALTPIVWLHYFALLLVPVAVARQGLALVWFVPLALVITPGSGHPSPFDTAWALAVATVTFALAIHASTVESRQECVRLVRRGGVVRNRACR